MENPATWSKMVRELNTCPDDSVESLAKILTKYVPISELAAQGIISRCIELHDDRIKKHYCGLSFGAQVEAFLETPIARTTEEGE